MSATENIHYSGKLRFIMPTLYKETICSVQCMATINKHKKTRSIAIIKLCVAYHSHRLTTIGFTYVLSEKYLCLKINI